MVAHNGSDYLPRTLAALADQTRSVDRAIGVDAASSDDSLILLEQALGRPNVISTSRAKGGMGAAVSAGLSALAPWSGEPGTRAEWIWLLHDDAAPHPGALAELLGAVERAPSVTVAGCKQLDWHMARRLVDVGLSTSRWAERLTLIDAEEMDQGQYDGRSDTFAVNSAGMLVRRDVWELLGGFDPALPGSGDDVDFCWRNRLAGHRVVVVPSARMYHVAHRPHGLGNPAAARKAQIHLRLKHAPLWMVPVHAAGAFIGSLVRLVFGVLVKDPGHGFSQMLATWAALGRPRAIARARTAARRTRRIRRSVIRKLQTPRREVWSHRRSLMEAFGSDTAGDDLEQDPLALQPSGDSSDDFAALATTRRGWVGNGAIAATGIAAVASVLALGGLFRAEAASGGALIPASAGLGEIWHHASSWWVSLGSGLPGHGDPFGYVLWLLGVLGGGDANAALVWLLLLGTPLSALTAWFAAGALTRRRRLRLVAGLFWAAAPALQVALNQGRTGALIAHVLLPLLVLALLRATGSVAGHGRFALSAAEPPPVKPGVNGTPSWTAAAAAGLVLAVITASAPSLLLPSVAVIAVSGAALRRRGRTLWWALLPAAALFIPFGLSVLDRPRALLADPGLPLEFAGAPLWQQVLGQPLEFDPAGGLRGLPLFLADGTPWALLLALLVGLPVLVFAAAGLLVPGRRSLLARALWVAGAVFLAGGWLAGHVATGLNADSLVVPFTGPVVSATALALLGAALIGAEYLLARAHRFDQPGRRRLAAKSAVALGTIALLAGPLAGMAAWSAQNLLRPPSAAAVQEPAAPETAIQQSDATPADSGADQPGAGPLGASPLVEASGTRTLPATAIDRGTGPEQTRTLLISTRQDGGFEASLANGAGTRLDSLSTVAAARNIIGTPGAETVREDDAATAALRRVVATLVAGQGVDPREDLEQLGAGFVVLRSADTAAQLTASRLDAVPGLAAVGQTDVGWLWRVTPLNQQVLEPAGITHRVRIVDAEGAAVALVPSHTQGVDAPVGKGPEGRLVVLAERADPGWSAWLDGRKLTATTSGWSQAFTLPPSGGQLTISYQNPWAIWSAIGQAVVIGLTVLLAIPMPARRVRTGLSRDEGSLRKEHQNA